MCSQFCLFTFVVILFAIPTIQACPPPQQGDVAAWSTTVEKIPELLLSPCQKNDHSALQKYQQYFKTPNKEQSKNYSYLKFSGNPNLSVRLKNNSGEKNVIKKIGALKKFNKCNNKRINCIFEKIFNKNKTIAAKAFFISKELAPLKILDKNGKKLWSNYEIDLMYKGMQLLKSRLPPSSFPIGTLASIAPFTKGEAKAAKKYNNVVGVAVNCSHTFLGKLGNIFKRGHNNSLIKIKNFTPPENPSEFMDTFLHEIGHIIDISQKNNFHKKFSSKTTCLVKPRSKENTYEEFANSFAAYLLNPDFLKKTCSEKFKLLNNDPRLNNQWDLLNKKSNYLRPKLQDLIKLSAADCLMQNTINKLKKKNFKEGPVRMRFYSTRIYHTSLPQGCIALESKLFKNSGCLIHKTAQRPEQDANKLFSLVKETKKALKGLLKPKKNLNTRREKIMEQAYKRLSSKTKNKISEESYKTFFQVFINI